MDIETKSAKPKISPRISVDYTTDMRRGRIFHIFDGEGHEVILSQKDAGDIARSILKITGVKE